MIFTDYWEAFEVYGLFLAKNLMEIWYSLGLFNVAMIFQDLGNMVFRAVKGYNVLLKTHELCPLGNKQDHGIWDESGFCKPS